MIQPLYKVHEPFMESPAGHGYLGVVMYDTEADTIQCHVCGKFYKCTGTHIRQAHGIYMDEYRDKFGLPIRGGLSAKSVLQKQSAASSRQESLKKLARCRKNTWRLPATQRQARCRKMSRQAIKAKARPAFANKMGLCKLQMRARFDVVRRIVGRDPTAEDVKKYDMRLWGKISNHETFNQWKQREGLPTIPQGRAHQKFGNLSLIAHLRRWRHKNKRTPSSHDFRKAMNGYPSKVPFIRAFGSWRRALSQAGLG